MKPLNWVELTRQQIKARHGFGWSIQGIEKQNKVITKIVYRFSNGQRSTVITDIAIKPSYRLWSSNYLKTKGAELGAELTVDLNKCQLATFLSCNKHILFKLLNCLI